MILEIGDRDAQSKLCQDLNDLSIRFVMARPTGSAKAMRRTISGKPRRRRSASLRLTVNKSRAFHVFSVRNNADRYGRVAGMAQNVVDLVYGINSLAANAPDRIARCDRQRIQRAVSRNRLDQHAATKNQIIKTVKRAN